MASLFFPSLPYRRLPGNPDEAHILLATGLRPGPARLRAILVVSRRLLRHRYFPLGTLPRRAWLASLSVQVRAWAPFPDAACVVVRHREGAMVLAWDRGQLRQSLMEAGLKGAWLRIVPETALQSTMPEGVRLVCCLEGVEGQFWRDGALVASRLWASRPNRQEWINFLRGAGVPPEQQNGAVPVCGDTPEWSDTARLEFIGLEALAGRETLWEHVLAGGLALALLVPWLWLMRQDLLQDEELHGIEARKEQLTAQAAPLLEARRRFQEDAQTTEAVLAATTRPNALTLLAYLERTLSAEGGALKEVEWQDGNFKVAVAPPSSASRLGLVKALERDGWLLAAHEASDSQPDLLVLEARLADPLPSRPGTASP